MRIFFLLVLLVLRSSDLISQCIASRNSLLLLRELNAFHYAPLPLNAASGERVIDEFFLQIDPHRILFDKNDINSMRSWANLLLDTGSNEACKFIVTTSDLYVQRKKELLVMLSELSKVKPAMNSSDTIFFQRKDVRSFESNHEERIKRIKKLFRFEYLILAMQRKEEGVSIEQYLASSDAMIRADVLPSFLCSRGLDEKSVVDEIFFIDCLLKAIAVAHDPHSAFFGAQEMQDFTSSLSSDSKTVGVFFEKDNNGNMLVGGLLPGGPAWKMNNVNVGDRIISVSSGSVNLSSFQCMEPGELENKIDFSNSDLLDLYIEKTGGVRVHVILRKEPARVDENVINSAILSDGSHKIGYVSLPAFYSSSSYFIDKGCANDLGKEIMKLNADKMSALILDLRNNGGGDLEEATDIAGLFIDVGPIGMMTDNSHKPIVIKELNKGVIYAGPLVILINSFSASASEVIAAVLQDYNRALIVGTTSYGKSTAQQIIPLPIEKLTGKSEGYVKETFAMLHRISGNTHQGVGVVPDIQLVDHLSDIHMSESEESYFLKGVQLDKQLVYKKFADLPKENLRKVSVTRQNANAGISWLLANKEKWPSMSYRLSLNASVFESDLNGLNAFEEIQEQMQEKITCPFTFASCSSNLALIEMDTYLSDVLAKQAEIAKVDYQLHETFQISIDLINALK